MDCAPATASVHLRRRHDVVPGRHHRATAELALHAHILVEGCRRWLAATTDAEHADNASWVREFLDRPLTRSVIEALLAD